jgi:hypothetical protein
MFSKIYYSTLLHDIKVNNASVSPSSKFPFSMSLLIIAGNWKVLLLEGLQ